MWQKKLRVQLQDEDEEYLNQNGVSFPFVDIGKDNRKLLKLGVYDPNLHHRTVYQGLNFQGTCKNSSCKIFDRRVWIRIGYGMFRVNQETEKARCPICNQQVPSETIKTLGYTEAKVKVDGKKAGEAAKFSWIDEQKQGLLVKFDGYDGGKTIMWNYLIITVTKI